ncbi:MAG: hypothetical protein HY791_33635 [Deltaproteobacteria bacterium]|nr:hypothetical protein [Deltaproteobacteria bacterium]
MIDPRRTHQLPPPELNGVEALIACRLHLLIVVPEVIDEIIWAQIRLSMSPNASHTIVGMLTKMCHF